MLNLHARDPAIPVALLKIRSISERWTIIAVSILMVLALGLLARSLIRNSRRADWLGTAALDRASSSQRWQLGLLKNAYASDLEQEAEYLALHDSLTDLDLIRRWLPVLRSRFAINAVGIANDRGDVRQLERIDSTWRFTSSIQSTTPPATRARVWPVRRSEVPPPMPGKALPDPRMSIWFSPALDNRQDEPVWTVGNGADGDRILHLSLLVRSKSAHMAYQVIHFDLDAGMMLGSIAQWTPDISTIGLSMDGVPFTVLDTSIVGRAWAKALRSWPSGRPTDVFRVTLDGREWTGRILPLELNGTLMQTGVMIGAGTVSPGSGQVRVAIWTVLVLLVLLGVLLGMVFLQSRGAERQVRKHERRSNLRARHLARAIDEREVLDREVHHRVKNNLQVVSSLLNLQAQRVPGDEARSEFLRGKRRIDSMALVHHKLYRQSDLSAVDLGVFLEDLAKAVAAMFEPDSRSVSHSVDAADIRSDADTSIQLGMILCELLANCHQHAFPYATGGHIHITVRGAGDGAFLLTVKDNGKGYAPEDVKEAHLGLEVVEALADQLDGTMHTRFGVGTTVEVTFRPVQHA